MWKPDYFHKNTITILIKGVINNQHPCHRDSDLCAGNPQSVALAEMPRNASTATAPGSDARELKQSSDSYKKVQLRSNSKLPNNYSSIAMMRSASASKVVSHVKSDASPMREAKAVTSSCPLPRDPPVSLSRPP